MEATKEMTAAAKALTKTTMGNAKALTKTVMVDSIATSLDTEKRYVARVIGALAGLGAKEVTRFGKFALPGLCMIKTMLKPTIKARV